MKKWLCILMLLLLCCTFFNHWSAIAQTRPTNSFSELIKTPWNYKSSGLPGTSRTFTDGIIVGKVTTHRFFFGKNYIVFIVDSSALSHSDLRHNQVIEVSVSYKQFKTMKIGDVIDATGWVFWKESPEIIKGNRHYLETGAASILVRGSIVEDQNFQYAVRAVNEMCE